MAEHAIAFLNALGLTRLDLLGFSLRWTPGSDS
jgi:hypothetical protein